MRPPRVLYLLRYAPTPSETFVFDEAQALARVGAEVRMCALDRVPRGVVHARHRELVDEVRWVPRGSRPAAWLASASMEDAPAFPLVRAHWSTHGRPADLRRVAWLARALRGRFDHLRVHFAGEVARYGVAAALLADVPASVAVHGRDLFVPAADMDWILGWASHVTTITPLHRELLLRRGLPSHKVELIRCPVAVPPRAARAPVDGPLRVLSVGRLVPKKGHDLLLRACATVARGGCPVRLTIVGDGPEGLALRALAAELRRGTPDLDVDLVGSQPNEVVQATLLDDGFHVFALASRVAADGDRDGVPVAALEALAAGVPVITTALPGMEYELADSGAICLPLLRGEGNLREASVDSLAEALARLARQPSERRALAEAGRRHLQGRPSADEIATRLLDGLRRSRATVAPRAPAA